MFDICEHILVYSTSSNRIRYITDFNQYTVRASVYINSQMCTARSRTRLYTIVAVEISPNETSKGRTFRTGDF